MGTARAVARGPARRRPVRATLYVELAMNRRDRAILLQLEARGLFTAEDLAACESEAAERAGRGEDVTALDLLVERGLVSRRQVNEVSCLESLKAGRRARLISGGIYAFGGLLALALSAWVMMTAHARSSVDSAKLRVRRPNDEALRQSDDSRATYLARKKWEIEQGRKHHQDRLDRLEELAATEAVRRAEEEKRRAEEEKQRLAAEAAAAAEAEKKRQEAESAVGNAARRELEAATAEFERFVPEIENYARIFQYRKAVNEYRKYRETLAFPELRQRVDRRVAELDKLAALMERLIEAVHRKILRDDKVRYGEGDAQAGTISDATEEHLEVSIKQGFIRTRWDFMRPAQMVDLFRRLALSPEEQVLLGCFCYEWQLVPDAHTLFLAAEKAKKELKGEVDAYLASKRGFAGVPAGGFVPYQGRLVTVEEKDYFDRGFISYGGMWIKPEEKVYVDKGWVKQDSKWIPRQEAELLAKGYRKYKEKWYSPEELVQIRSNWADAWELETDHYRIRTNTDEAFCLELARVMEQSFAAYQEHYNRKYEGPKMNLYAFRSFEDYRAFCIEQKLESHIPAAGHANGAKNYGCGYAKYGGNKELISTMIHEGSHLFYDRAVQGIVPSWFHEGQATYFEGYTWDGTTLKFHHVSPARLPWLRQALVQGGTLPLRDLIQGDALSSIQRGARDSTLFYSQAWGLYYFLCHGPNEDLKKKFSELREKYASRAFGFQAASPQGAFASFTGVMGSDWDALEAQWKEFILGLR